jgi:hypothetical protein
MIVLDLWTGSQSINSLERSFMSYSECSFHVAVSCSYCCTRIGIMTIGTELYRNWVSLGGGQQ